MHYRDDEEDEIEIASDKDLQEAVDFYQWVCIYVAHSTKSHHFYPHRAIFGAFLHVNISFFFRNCNKSHRRQQVSSPHKTSSS